MSSVTAFLISTVSAASASASFESFEKSLKQRYRSDSQCAIRLLEQEFRRTEMMTMVETMMATSIEVGIVILFAYKIDFIQRSFLDLNEKDVYNCGSLSASALDP